MAFFFKRELSPVERFENALKDKLAARQKLAERLSVAESELGEKRAEAERLAVAGAGSARLDRAEANMRVVEDRAKAQRAALVEFDEQVASAERALADAKAQRDRDIMADEIDSSGSSLGGRPDMLGAPIRCRANTCGQCEHHQPRAIRVRTAAIGRGRAAIDLHPPSVALAGGQRGAQSSGFCAGRVTQNAAARSAAASACGPSQRPACPDTDAPSWQRGAPQRPRARRSAVRRSRCSGCRRQAERASRCCMNLASDAEPFERRTE